MKYCEHAQEMLSERNIPQRFVDDAVENPDRVEEHEDGTRHYLKEFPEEGNKWLRVVVNSRKESPQCVTAFFDRRLRRSQQ